MEPEDKEKDRTGIDLNKILLPKKEVHDPANAERINAGALLKQEQAATLPRQEPVQRYTPVELGKKEENIVKPLETFQGDIEKLMAEKNISVVSIAAAEATRRAQEPVNPHAEAKKHERGWGGTLAMVAGGAIFFAAAAGVIVFVYLRTKPIEIYQRDLPAPFIAVDATYAEAFEASSFTRNAFMTKLERLKDSTELSLGLIGRLYLAEASTTAETYEPLGTSRLMSLLAPHAPSELVRTMTDVYLIGVHSFEENQPFLLVRVDSYSQAFGGMLAWEESMQSDLHPFFERTPRPLFIEEQEQRASEGAMQGGGFIDAIVENRNVRALYNEYGDILLLWTMLDRSTLFITTNEYSLREVVSRFGSTPATI